MKKILFILLLTIPFVGFGQDHKEDSIFNVRFPNFPVTDSHSDGEYKDGEKHGVWKWYRENGQLKTEGNYNYGIKDGIWKDYYKNGKIHIERNYKNGFLDGNKSWKWYYENGQLQKIGNHKNGKRDGVWKWYRENGQLKEEGNYTNFGTKDGVWKLYYRNGEIQKEEYWEDGSYNTEKWYYENGSVSCVRYSYNTKDGEIEFITEFYYQNNQLKEKKIDGIKGIREEYVKLHKCWDENGKEIECK